MITRDITGALYVPAFDQKTFGSCASPRFDHTCGYNPIACDGVGTVRSGFNGRIIDRLALPTQFNSALVVAQGMALVECCSTGQVGSYRTNYIGLAVGLDHNCSTGAGWVAFATEAWSTEFPAFLQSTASTWNQYLTTATDTGSALCTSTGQALVSAFSVFDLTNAKRYVRICVVPRIESSGCSVTVPIHGGILFHGAQVAPTPVFNADARIVVTSGCSTST